MKSVVAFAFGAIAGIFGFQKQQELRGATKTSSSSKNAIVEAKRTTGEDAAPAKKDKGEGGEETDESHWSHPGSIRVHAIPWEAFSYDCWETHDRSNVFTSQESAQLDALVVATDDERIRDAIVKAGGDVVMTDEDIPNGTERCAQAVDRTAGEYDIVVNIQGDEPLIEPEIIDEVVVALKNAPKDCVYSTPVTPLKHEEVTMQGRVKCITDVNGYAIYFSRGMLPNNKKGKVDTCSIIGYI